MPLTVYEQASFFRRWHSLLHGGLSNFEIMKLMTDKPAIPSLKPVANSLASPNDVRPIHQQMLSQSRYFNRLQIAMVKAGENSGYMVESLNLLASYAEQEIKLRNEIKLWSFGTKLLLAVFALVVLIVLLNTPRYASVWYIKLLLVFVVLITLSTIIVILVKQTQKGQTQSDAIALQLPIFETGNRLAATSKFLFGLSMLYKAGCSLSESISIAADATGNSYISQRIGSISTLIYSGGTLAECLQKSEILDPETIHIIATGETSGSVDVSVHRLAEHYDQLARIELNKAYRILVTVIGTIVSLMVALWVILFYLSRLGG